MNNSTEKKGANIDVQIIQLEKVDYLQINLLDHIMFIQIFLLQYKRKYYFALEKRNPAFSLRLLESIFIRILEKGQSFKIAKYQWQLWSSLLNLEISYAKILMWEYEIHKIPQLEFMKRVKCP